MYLIILLSIFVNIVAITGLLLGLFHKFEQPKSKAVFGYFVAGSMMAYIIILSVVAIQWWFSNPGLSALGLTLCIISPFVIGKLVNFETLKKYTVIQIMFYIVSLVVLLFKIV